MVGGMPADTRPPATAAQHTGHACEALAGLRQQLTSLTRMGSGVLHAGLLQAAVDDCPEPVVVTDREAQIVMVNGAAGRLLGTPTRELQQLTIWDITHVTFQADFDVLWKEFLRAGRQRGQYAVRHKDGSIVEVAYCSQTNVMPDRHVIVLRRLS
jgi:PAS domain S-box-containing protein